MPIDGLPKGLSSEGFIAVTLQCPGRGTPKQLCHLYKPSPTDYPAAWKTSSEALSGRPTAFRPAPGVEAAPAEPPCHPNVRWLDMRLDQPPQTSLRLRNLRQAAEAEKDSEPKRPTPAIRTLRQLLGFVTSGGFSYRQGCGVGVGVVAVSGLLEALQAQVAAQGSPSKAAALQAADLGAHWILLWARNTSSLVYFPLWARVLFRDEGLG